MVIHIVQNMILKKVIIVELFLGGETKVLILIGSGPHSVQIWHEGKILFEKKFSIK